jgi:hypothetical protein
MAQWKTVATGASLNDLESTIGELQLPKGTPMKIYMDTPVSWAFDAFGAELLFKPYVPDGMELVDVYEENGRGVVEMEADPAWLLAVVAFIKAHWLAIVIAGFVLSFIVSAVIVSVRIPEEAIPETLGKFAMWAAIGIVGVVAVTKFAQSSYRAPPRRGAYR